MTSEEQRQQLQEALTEYLQQIRGVPLSVEDISVRFVVYASIMQQSYGMKINDMISLLELASKVQLTVQKVSKYNSN